MDKDRRRYVRPGSIASEHYLQIRENQIKENKQKFEALGLYNFTCSRGGPSFMFGHGMNEVGRNREGEDDYVLSDHDDDDEYSLSSSSNEVREMPHARSSRRRSHKEVSSAPNVRDHPTSIVHEEAVGSTSRDLSSIPEEPTDAVPGSSTRTRGVARGFQIGNGDERPVVPIPTLWNAPIGQYAIKFVGEAGCRVRRDVANLHCRWAKIPGSETAPIMQTLKNKFDLQGEPDVVNNVLKTKCAGVARSYRYKLHSKYQNLVDEHNSEYARNHPPSFISPETWGNLIDYWTNPKSIAISTTNKANRSMSKTNHSCGSKSFPIRATEKMDKSDGSLGSFSEFYKETHYNAKRGKWATPECESLHVEMARDEEAQNSQTDAVPLTVEEMSIKHLRARSGVVKGIGMRPSSSLRTIGASLQGHNDEVRLLNERTQKMEEQLQLERQQRLQLEQKFNALMDFVKFGHQGPHPPPDNGDSNNNQTPSPSRRRRQKTIRQKQQPTGGSNNNNQTPFPPRRRQQQLQVLSLPHSKKKKKKKPAGASEIPDSPPSRE